MVFKLNILWRDLFEPAQRVKPFISEYEQKDRSFDTPITAFDSTDNVHDDDAPNLQRPGWQHSSCDPASLQGHTKWRSHGPGLQPVPRDSL